MATSVSPSVGSVVGVGLDVVEVELGLLVPEDAEVVEVVEDVGLSEIALATSA